MPPLQVSVAPLALFSASVTAVPLSVVTTAPEASSTETVGCVPSGEPALPPVGCCVKTSFVAGPVTTNEPLSAAVAPALLAAWMTYVPATVTLQPAKVATPAATVFVSPPVQLSVPPPGPEPTLSVTTVVVSDVTVALPGSCTVTTGCVPSARFVTPFDGCCVKARWFTGAVTLKLALCLTRQKQLGVAVMVSPVPAALTVQPANVATPATVAAVNPPGLVQLSVPAPLRLSVTAVPLSPVSVAPVESWRATTGCVGSGVPTLPFDGCCVNASFPPMVCRKASPAPQVLLGFVPRGSAHASSCATTCAGVSDGYACRTSAARPTTCGDAWLVPQKPLVPYITVLAQSVALMSGFVRPSRVGPWLL